MKTLDALRNVLCAGREWVRVRESLRKEFLRRKRGFGKRRKSGYGEMLSTRYLRQVQEQDVLFLQKVKNAETSTHLPILAALIKAPPAPNVVISWAEVMACSDRISRFEETSSSWDKFAGLRPIKR